jgi:hypothetical protein
MSADNVALLKKNGFPENSAIRYSYAPVLSVFYVSFSMFDYGTASKIFTFVNYILIVLTVLLLKKHFNWNLTLASLFFLIMTYFHPVEFSIILGQTNMFVLLFMVLFISLKSHLWKGFFLALALFFKIHLIILVLFLLLNKDFYKTILFSIFSGIAVILFFLPVTGFDSYMSYFSAATSITSLFYVRDYSFSTIVSFFTNPEVIPRIARNVYPVIPRGFDTITLLSYSFSLLAFAFSMFSAFRYLRCSNLILPFGISSISVISPVNHPHYLTYSLIPLAFFLSLNNEIRKSSVFFLTGFFLCFFPPVYFFPGSLMNISDIFVFMHMFIPFLSVVLMWAGFFFAVKK